MLAEFQLAHLYHIAKEVSALRKTEDESYEQYLLAKEQLLHTVSESLGTDDVRDLALTQQVESMALQAGSIKGKLMTTNAALLALKSDSTQSSTATESLRAEFKSQLINLNHKYDTLVIENSELNKTVQNKNIEIIRLQAYKEAVTEIESKHSAEKTLALKAQAKKEAKQKTLALKQKTEREALALVEKAKKEAEQQAIALKEKMDNEARVLTEKVTPEVSQSVESVTETTTKLESTADVVKVQSVQ